MASSQRDMVLCVRCPDSASAHLSKHNNDFAKCQKEHPLTEFPLDGQTHIGEDDKTPHADRRWWGFTASPVDTTQIDLTQRDTCTALLAQALAVSPITRNNKPPSNAEITSAATLKKESTFRGISITKDMLETALRITSLPEESGRGNTQAVDPTAGISAPTSSSGKDGMKSDGDEGAAIDKSSKAEASSAAPQSSSGPFSTVQESAVPQIAGPSNVRPAIATSSTARPLAEVPTTTSASLSTEIDNGMSMLHLQSQPETEVQVSGSNTPRATATHNPQKRPPPEVVSAPPAHPLTAHHGRPNSGNSSRPKAPIVGHAGGTPSGQPPNLDGELKVNENEAKKKTTAFAEAYGQKSTPSKKPEAVMQELGLRKEFAGKMKTYQVLTNYIQMQLPVKLHVYKVEMIRDESKYGNILVKRFADKRAVIESLVRMEGSVLRMRRQDWVTDGDLIWSCEPLFSANQPFDNVGYLNECGKSLTVKKVTITPQPSIDCRQPVSELFPVGSNNLFANSNAPVLLRGLNAILTVDARNRNVPFTSGNKGYLTELPRSPPRNYTTAPGDLTKNSTSDAASNRASSSCIIRSLPGFFLSARPGVDRLLLNINNARSPFFKPNMTVQDVFDANLPPNWGTRSGKEISRVLKGVKVRIRYKIKGDPIARDPEERRCVRFVKQIGASIAQQPCDPSQNINGQVTMLRSWFLSPAPSHREHEFFPLDFKGLNLNTNVLAVQVATDSRPDSTDTEWYPASALLIEPNQPWHGDLTPEETTVMIGHAQLRPESSHNAITNDGLRMLGLDTQNSWLTRFGMVIGKKLITIDAKHVNAPRICYRGNGKKSVDADMANWDLKGMRFISTPATRVPPQGLSCWNISELPNGPGTVRDFQARMRTALTDHGLQGGPGAWNTMSPQGQFRFDPMNIPAYEHQSRNAMAAFPQATLTVLLPKKEYDVYACVKRVAELHLGLNTVCHRMDGGEFKLQNASNMAMKYNLKAVGINHSLDNAFQLLQAPNEMSNKTTIVIGADVTHPGAGASPGTPSIAAVVGSTDNNFTHFPGSMRLQRARKEDIVELGDMVKERLLDWAKEHKGYLPKRMLFYRDGVSESQYEKLREYELPQIKKAYNWAREYLNWVRNGQRPGRPQASLGTLTPAVNTTPHPNQSRALDPSRDPWPRPEAKGNQDETFEDTTALDENFELTYVVVGKRHHTRFYPVNRSNSIDKNGNNNGNVKPGMLVDTDITHPHSLDFYLQSHCPLKGTGRAAHYVVLCNHMGLSTEDLQRVTHNFCHIYARSTTAVSYCAPAYYADRLCDRGRAYLRHMLLNRNDGSKKKDAKPTDGNAGLYHPPERDGRNETPTQFNDRVKNEVRDDPNWRPYHNTAYPGQQNPPMKYGFTRRNPWHANLDNVMFYL